MGLHPGLCVMTVMTPGDHSVSWEKPEEDLLRRKGDRGEEPRIGLLQGGYSGERSLGSLPFSFQRTPKAEVLSSGHRRLKGNVDGEITQRNNNCKSPPQVPQAESPDVGDSYPSNIWISLSSGRLELGSVVGGNTHFGHQGHLRWRCPSCATPYALLPTLPKPAPHLSLPSTSPFRKASHSSWSASRKPSYTPNSFLLPSRVTDSSDLDQNMHACFKRPLSFVLLQRCPDMCSVQFHSASHAPLLCGLVTAGDPAGLALLTSLCLAPHSRCSVRWPK